MISLIVPVYTVLFYKHTKQEICYFSFQKFKNEIFKTIKMFKCNMKFTRAACWINSKMSSRNKKPHSWYSYFVTLVGHYYGVIIEGV